MRGGAQQGKGVSMTLRASHVHNPCVPHLSHATLCTPPHMQDNVHVAHERWGCRGHACETHAVWKGAASPARPLFATLGSARPHCTGMGQGGRGGHSRVGPAHIRREGCPPRHPCARSHPHSPFYCPCSRAPLPVHAQIGYRLLQTPFAWAGRGAEGGTTLLTWAPQFVCSAHISGIGSRVVPRMDPGHVPCWGVNRGRGERGGAGFCTVLCESSGVRAKGRGEVYLSCVTLLPPIACRGGVAPTPCTEGGRSRPAHVEQGGVMGTCAQVRARGGPNLCPLGTNGSRGATTPTPVHMFCLHV